MTTYTTRDLATEVIGDDSKAATRTLRKFLRDRATEAGGTVGVDTPGKGGRYVLDFTKPQLRKLIKDFGTWQVAQEEAKAARAALLAAKGEAIILPTDDSADEEALAANEESDNGAEGPSDEEIAAMLSDDEEIDIEGESF
jgi:hypothetical protein